MFSDFENLQDHVFRTLKEKLPEYLTYYSIDHTKYVLDKVIHISSKKGVSMADLLLLKVDALYHDIGFTEANENHEDIGNKIAQNDLKLFHFSEEEISRICGMIKLSAFKSLAKLIFC